MQEPQEAGFKTAQSSHSRTPHFLRVLRWVQRYGGSSASRNSEPAPGLGPSYTAQFWRGAYVRKFWKGPESSVEISTLGGPPARWWLMSSKDSMSSTQHRPPKDTVWSVVNSGECWALSRPLTLSPRPEVFSMRSGKSCFL